MSTEDPRTAILALLNHRQDQAATQTRQDNSAVNFGDNGIFLTAATRNGAAVLKAENIDRAMALIRELSVENNWLQPPVFAPSIEDASSKSSLWPTLGLDCAAEGCVGVSVAYCAIADTGTLVLNSSTNSPASLNFLPEHHVVLLTQGRTVMGKQDVWQLMKQERIETPRAINLISGPSRTADIEQTIQLGAHGPRTLTIILIDKTSL
ncbi:LutC/YkgG family protein [Ketobacter alkanivorans]|uniref:LUD domain-containing protein n=1 Tax=Ketobacter alkanivorans TaxID=1917421 RepID=A0A2K9LFU2_9GAMM|nr:LUD domain-containing protein [Ketobacter alkanivorans]AUM11246.1 hypothetical protein Kalk_01845 [Ketobacter alkanivorans]